MFDVFEITNFFIKLKASGGTHRTSSVVTSKQVYFEVNRFPPKITKASGGVSQLSSRISSFISVLNQINCLSL